MIRKFLKDEDGQDVIEWGLLAAFLSITLIGTISLSDIGDEVKNWYLMIYNKITSL